MRFSMFSPTQHEDKKFLLELIDLIELLAKINTTETLDLAERFGEHYVELQSRIATHDYSKDDEEFYELINLVK